MYNDSNRISLQNALYKGDFEHAFDKITDNIALIKNNLNELQDYVLRIGSKADTKSRTIKIDDIILSTGNCFTETFNYLKDIKEFNYEKKRSTRLENVKRAKEYEETLIRHKNKFEDSVKKIQNQNRISIDKARESFRMSNASNPKMSNAQAQLNGKEFLEEVELKEKEIKVITQVFNQLNDISKKIADTVIEGGKKIDTIEDNVNLTAKNISNAANSMQTAKKYNESTGGYTNKLLYIVVGIVGVLIILSIIMPKD